MKAKAQCHDYPQIYDSVTGMLFLGTPHHGSETLKNQKKLYSQILKAKLHVQDNILQSLAEDNDVLVGTVHSFTRDLSTRPHPPKLFCFFEQKATNIERVIGRDGPLVRCSLRKKIKEKKLQTDLS